MAGVILLVEDEANIGQLVRTYLEREGYHVVWTRSGEEALVVFARRMVRMVILDLGLPGMDGLEVCRRLRAGSQVPVIMLTARDEEVDRVLGLELGADDYVPKPFSPRELVARVRAVLRRSEAEQSQAILAFGDVTMSREAREVSVGGRRVDLTAKEFDLLAHFLENPGVVLTREQLLDSVWGLEYPGGTRTVDVHIAQLRHKLDRPGLIRTVIGVGYKAVSA
jgi:DNA-binding response OmpR family regulator